MNKIAIALNVIGVLAIIGGLIVGFTLYEVPREGYETLTEKNYTVLITWVAAGAISGILMFGFAEVINLLDKIKNKIVGTVPEKEKGKITKYIESTFEK